MSKGAAGLVVGAMKVDGGRDPEAPHATHSIMEPMRWHTNHLRKAPVPEVQAAGLHVLAMLPVECNLGSLPLSNDLYEHVGEEAERGDGRKRNRTSGLMVAGHGRLSAVMAAGGVEVGLRAMRRHLEEST